MQAKPAVEKLMGQGVELVALGKGTEEAVLQTLFDISDGSARYGVDLLRSVMADGPSTDRSRANAHHTYRHTHDRYSHGSYDPIEHIWRWLSAEVGPFETAAEFKGAWRKLLGDSAAGDKLQLAIVRGDDCPCTQHLRMVYVSVGVFGGMTDTDDRRYYLQ